MQDELIIEVNEKFPGELIKCSKVGFHERIYRNMKYIIFEDVVCPAHVSNFKFLEYLMKEVVKGGDDILDMCAGAGAVGLPLLRERDVRSVVLVDLNYQAIRSIRETAKLNKIQNVRALLSEGFESVPFSEKFDVIVANPPIDDRPTPSLLSLAEGYRIYVP